MKSNADHTSITAGCSAAMSAVPTAAPTAQTAIPTRPRRSAAVHTDPSITVGTLTEAVGGGAGRDQRGAA
jgi:hypothetical protein